MKSKTLPDAERASFFHVTTPAIASIILAEGFKDNAASKGIPGIVTHRFEPGVWLADVPPITAISVDQYLGYKDEAWIEVEVTLAEFQAHFRGNEWQDESWPTEQWLVPAAVVNQFPRSEMPLVDVLRIRIANESTEHHRFVTAEMLKKCIETQMEGAIQRKWLSALAEAVERPYTVTTGNEWH